MVMYLMTQPPYLRPNLHIYDFELLNPLIANLLIDYFEVQKWSLCMNYIYAHNFLCSVEGIPGPEVIPGSETNEVKAKSQQDKVC